MGERIWRQRANLEHEMAGRDTDSTVDENTVISPFYPSETPSIPGSGRTWFAILVTVLLLLGAVFGALDFLLGL